MQQNLALKILKSIEVLEHQQRMGMGKGQEYRESTNKAIFGGKNSESQSILSELVYVCPQENLIVVRFRI